MKFYCCSTTYLNLAILAFCLPTVTLAQQATATLPQQFVYAGEPFQLRILATSFPEDAEIKVEYLGQTSPKMEVVIGETSRQQSTYIHSDGGKVTRRSEYRFVIPCEIILSEPGKAEIGSFRVTGGDVVAETRPIQVECKPVDEDEDLFIELQLGEKSKEEPLAEATQIVVYVGQHVPVMLTWGYAGEMVFLDDIRLNCPIYDMFHFRDLPLSAIRKMRGQPEVMRLTGNGITELVGIRFLQERNSKRVQATSLPRILVPNKPGDFEIPSSTISARKVSRDNRFGRDPFFSNFFTPSAGPDDRPIRASTPSFKLRVLPIPTEGRPKSFAGVVGEKFDLEVSTNRNTVRIGDPLRLSVVLRGEDSLETASFPLMSQPSLMNQDFSFDSDAPTGIWDADRKEKTFSLTLRPLKETIQEIPPLEFSWFDPRRAEFRTIRSKPLALEVLPTQLVTSRDAIGDVNPNPVRPAHSKSPTVGTESNAGDLLSPSDVVQRDLSLVSDVERLFEPAGKQLRRIWLSSWLAAGITLVAAGWYRYQVTTLESRQHRRALRGIGRAWDAAIQAGPTRETAARLARYLWQARPHVQSSLVPVLEKHREQLELLAYAPPGYGVQLDQQLFEKPRVLGGKSNKLS